MNDPIKDFVAKHREDFDHLEAPEFDLAGFKSRLNNSTPKKQPLRIWNRKPWAIAAAVLVLFTIGLLLFKKQFSQTDQRVQTVAKKQPVVKPVNPQIEPKKNLTVNNNPERIAQLQVNNSAKKTLATYKIEDGLKQLYQKLVDSSSASTRLAAVLTIGKSDRVSYDTFDRLSKTIQNDGSSNVRLAALNVLEKYQTDQYVSKLLVAALNNQHDPTVQLVLVNLLGRMEHIKIDEKLYALVNDPNTFGAVKDEAYNILLKENKL